MMRYLEYIYLLAAVGVAVFMAATFKDLGIGSKVLLSFAVMLCTFMYSFRRKQRAMMEEFDRKSAEEENEAAANEQDTEENER